MWTVYESRKAEKAIDKLPKHVLEKYEFWKSTIQISGPKGVQAFPGFKDHALTGQWKGNRSSYLNDSFRVIYSVEGNEIRVDVEDVTHHDYRRKK